VREGVLFEITKDQLETGMRGFPVGYCVTSYVDPTKGLTYVGRPIAEMANKDPLEVIYLLYYGEPATKSQLDHFAKELSSRADCHPETLRHIDALPKTGHPMDLYAAAFLIAGMYEASGDYREDCLRLIAKAPQLAAHVINSHAGWGMTPPSNPSLGYMENFLHMLKN
jgi:citrate synthase